MTQRCQWQRVRRDRPCPICERSDWCLLAPDGSAAICARIESLKRCGEAGWLHRLRDDLPRPHRIAVRSLPLPTGEPRHDLASLASGYRDCVNSAQLDALAGSLGLSVDSLNALGVGWAAHYPAWSFPMRDASGNVLGIRLRGLDGRKWAVRGGREGLFLPATDPTEARLLVCEGPTDTAALLDLGFRHVAGRPSCTGGIKLLVELVRKRLRPEVVILADSDAPGVRGAENLASVLLDYAPAVQVIQPPAGIKDARDWLRTGGNRNDVEQAIAAAPARRLVICGRRQEQRG